MTCWVKYSPVSVLANSTVKRRNLPLYTLLFGVVMAVNSVQAEQPCFVPMPSGPATAAAGDEQTIYISADESESWGKGDIQLRGDIELIQGNRLLRAEQAAYYRDDQRITAEGGVSLTEEGLLLKGKRIMLDAQSEAATLEGGSYQIAGRSARGAAEKISIISREHILLEDASYTTCPPGDESWRFRAASITLKPAENDGVARHMRLEVLGVPVFYFPYINFPLGERKTGLLSPSIGSSDSVGREVTIPFYWNIAPERDATLSVRQMSRRGTQLSAEFRYLNENGEGQLDAEYLSNDHQRETSRHFFQYQHQSYWQAWQASIDLQQLSDRDYFRDLSQEKERYSSRLLESSATLNYADDSWYWSLALQHNKSLDDPDLTVITPTQRLPQLRFAHYRNFTDKLNFSLEGEFASFQKGDDLIALRLDIKPTLSAYYGDSAAYLKPSIGWQGTGYWVDGNPSELRQLPTVSLDSGLWFERQQKIGKKQYQQSLEPRLYLLYVPYRDQENLPTAGQLFDTQLSEFDFDSLFSENRYSGIDRVGDEQRVTLSLASRWFDEQGRQRLQMSIGQRYNLAEQRVILADETAAGKGWSNLLAEIDGQVNRFITTSGLMEWNNRQGWLEKANFQLAFERDRKRRVALGLNFRRALLKQSTFKARWPLSGRWSIMGDLTYSFYRSQALNTQLGLEYDNCCWRIRIAAQEYINDNDGSRNSGIAIQFELKGLTSVGSKISGFSEHKSSGQD